jgi:hypothetical protein
MTRANELLELAITMLKTGGPEYDSRDVLDVLEQLKAALCVTNDVTR